MTTPIPSPNHPDVLLIGAGIMSATPAVFLKELAPSLKIEIYEVLGSEAQESSSAWNNAGAGHAALCELNYTPQKSDGSIDIPGALQVNTDFDLSSIPFITGWNIPMIRSRLRNGSRWAWKGAMQASKLRRRECGLVPTWIMVPSQKISSIPYGIRMDSAFTFSVECKICDAMGVCGACESGTKKAVSTGMSRPNLSSSVLVADRSRCCKNPRFLKGRATLGSR